MTILIDNLSGTDDFLIYCAGFEERSKWIVSRSKNYSSKNIFLIKYDEIIPKPSSAINETELTSKLNSIGSVTEIKINPKNPISQITSMVAKIREHGQNVKITIDATVMSKYLLLLTLRGLAEYNLLSHARIIYTEPEDYAVTISKLSFGASKLDVIPTFEGNHNPRGKTLLVILLGYEGDRAFSLWEKIEPNECVLCFPDPPYKEGWDERTKRYNREIIAAVGEDKLIPLSSRNPIEVMTTLDNIVKKNDPEKKKNCLISPMGTKPQTIGTFFYYWNSHFYPTLVYSTPQAHAEYSTGIGKTYEIETPNLL